MQAGKESGKLSAAASLLATGRPADEPSRRRWFLPALLVLIVLSIPWYRQAGEIGPIVAGLPAWVWWPLASSAGVSVVTAAAALFCWRDDAGD